MSAQSPTTHVIFDYNGTITDLNRSLKKILALYGDRIDMDAIIAHQSEFPEIESLDDIIKIFYESLKSPSSVNYEEFTKEWWDIVFKVGFPLMPGVDKLIKHLYKNNIPMAIASNVDKVLLETEMKVTFGWDMSLISHYVCGADDPEVKANKPAPDVYLVCAQRFDPAPQSMDSCVIFEDSLRGITGAVNTGMKTVLINDKPIVSSDEIATKITVIIDSFDNFRPESVGLPPY